MARRHGRERVRRAEPHRSGTLVSGIRRHTVAGNPPAHVLRPAIGKLAMTDTHRPDGDRPARDLRLRRCTTRPRARATSPAPVHDHSHASPVTATERESPPVTGYRSSPGGSKGSPGTRTPLCPDAHRSVRGSPRRTRRRAAPPSDSVAPGSPLVGPRPPCIPLVALPASEPGTITQAQCRLFS